MAKRPGFFEKALVAAGLMGGVAKADDEVAMGQAYEHQVLKDEQSAADQHGPQPTVDKRVNDEFRRAVGNSYLDDDGIQQIAVDVAKKGGMEKPTKWEGGYRFVVPQDTNKGAFYHVALSAMDNNSIAVAIGEDIESPMKATLNAKYTFSLDRHPEVKVKFDGLVKDPSVTLAELARTVATRYHIEQPTVSIKKVTHPEGMDEKHPGLEVAFKNGKTGKVEKTYFLGGKEKFDPKNPSPNYDTMIVEELGSLEGTMANKPDKLLTSY